MKKLLLFLAVFVSLAFWACSGEKDVAGISTVETENAYLIQFVRGDSLPAAHVVARVRSAEYVRSVEDGSAVDSADAEFFSEFVTDSLGCIRIDSLAVDVATLEVVDAGEGLFKKISAEDIKDGDSVRFVLEKTGNLKGRVYLPEGVDYAWVQVYGMDRLVKTDNQGFYAMDSLPPFEYELRYIVGDSVVEGSATVDAGEEATAFIYTFEPDSVKILDFESENEEFFITDLGYSVTGYMAATDTNTKTVPDINEEVAKFITEAGAGREGRALHWKSSAAVGKWSFFGSWICKEESPCDISATDSIVFYARGTGVISIAFETLGSSNVEGKTLAYDTLATDGEWSRRVIKPSNFKPRDDLYGNLGWDVVSKAMTTISIAAYDDTEFWIDDVVLYGVKPSNFVER
ncbi:hypothetical protein [Fibrobacter sp.]|uniref:hypothetical protein n=1 Tax=Fibrobacter sp. TaxID=35828 RepID=UPI0025BBFC7F|nr:hypothetical protein [Fibrobacter sp.]MCI6436083.1 hypothetical protein [Fibrobacter sp.]MDD7498693.1 hypothetical protein [Fibrobacter sp.]MDY5725267.1 hypothetical protein [Fibrobacter sp.]